MVFNPHYEKPICQNIAAKMTISTVCILFTELDIHGSEDAKHNAVTAISG